MSSDGGALLLRAVDQRIGLTQRLAACFADHRNSGRCEHALPHLLAQRLFGLVLGYEDLCDHDRLRDDSLLALAVGRDGVDERAEDLGVPVLGVSAPGAVRAQPVTTPGGCVGTGGGSEEESVKPLRGTAGQEVCPRSAW